MKNMRILLALLATSMVVWAAPKTSFPDISQADLEAAVKAKKVVLVDCNGSKSFAEGHIPGAIDFEKNENTLGKVLPKDKEALIVAYCGGPQCHLYEKGAAATKALGYNNVKHYVGGISGWQKAKLPVETAKK